MRVVACAVVLTIAGAGICLAEDGLEGDTLRKVVAGKTVHLETPLGSLPINYKNNGTMQASTIQLAAYTGSTRDRGTGGWWRTNCANAGITGWAAGRIVLPCASRARACSGPAMTA